MTATNQDVIDEVNSLKGFHDQVIAEADAATQAALSAAVAANATKPRITTNQTFYYDESNANGSRDGLTPATAFNTLSELFQNCVPSVFVNVLCLSGVVLSSSYYLKSPPCQMVFQGWDAVNNVALKRAFSTTAGSIFFSGNCCLVLKHMDFDLSATSGAFTPIFGTDFGVLTAIIDNCSLIKTGTGMFFRTNGFLNIKATNFILDPSAEGSFLFGTAANGDPNAQFGVTSDLTSA